MREVDTVHCIDPDRRRQGRRSSVILLVAVATVAAGACSAPMRRAVSPRPTVVVSREARCRPETVARIQNVGACRVRLVATDEHGDAVGASRWISPAESAPPYQLPGEFTWVLLQVDPGCDEEVGSLRYTTTGSSCSAPAVMAAQAQAAHAR